MEPGDTFLDYVLLPVGYAYNMNIASAKKGDVIRFSDGDDREIFAVRKLRMGSDTDLLCRMRYGITLKGALVRWKMNAKLEGHGEKAVSEDECLWVLFRPMKDE